MKLSARNQIPARITKINGGQATANIEMDADGVRLVASITVEAVRELELEEGSTVTAVIKASDVIVAKEGRPAAGGPPPGARLGQATAQLPCGRARGPAGRGPSGRYSTVSVCATTRRRRAAHRVGKCRERRASK